MAYADRNYPRSLKICVTCSTEYRPTGARQVACADCKQARRKNMRQQRIPLKVIGCIDCGASIQKNGRQRRCRECQKKHLLKVSLAWNARNPDKAQRRLRAVRCFEHERELISRIYEDRDLINRIFPHVKAHVDHIVPLKHHLVSGLHVVANLRVIRGSENLKKRNKLMETIAP
jgi:DNA-directed RNA polymerase subunit RPC12/RpoP